MLKETDAKSYWNNRADKLGKTAVGFADQSLSTQDTLYSERIKFLKENMDFNLPTLDYGCGIGRYSSLFPSYYVGCDMTQELLKIASLKEDYNHKFVLLNKPYFSSEKDFFEKPEWLRQFFTATVLQHCHDNLVIKIFKSLHKYKPKDFNICLYENSMDFSKPHVVGRTNGEYFALITGAGFEIKRIRSSTHSVKNELHTFSRFVV